MSRSDRHPTLPARLVPVLLLLLGCTVSGNWTPSLSGRPPAGEPAPECMAEKSAEPTLTQGDVPIAWLRTSARDIPALDAWCNAVGPVHASLGSFEPAPGAVDSLVVVNWNVHVGSADLRRLLADLRDGAFTGGRPVGAFVVLLQEAHRAGTAVPSAADDRAIGNAIADPPPSGDRLDIVATARLLGLNLLYVPSMRNGRRTEDRGNAILSTLPISRPAAIELPFERQRRVAVAASIEGVTTSGEPWHLRVVSAHLENRARWSHVLDSFGAARARQARALAHALDGASAGNGGDAAADGNGAAAPAEPAEGWILGADLNTWSPDFLESALDILRARFPHGPRNREPTLDIAGIELRVDHLLFRMPDGWQATLERVDDRYGSDHYPLIGTVRIGARTD